MGLSHTELGPVSTESAAQVLDLGEPTPARFSEPITVVGTLSAILGVSSSAEDTNWFITLHRVTEQGALSRDLERVMIRARFRDWQQQPELLNGARSTVAPSSGGTRAALSAQASG